MALRPTLTCLGLCAGVGGLELGIRLGEHLRGYDVRGVCYVEREAAGAASLVASMDAGWLHPAPVWSDLATFDGRPWRGRVHILASGDPCQGNSVAGKGLGADDERFLIPQVLRIVDEVRPDRVVRENVTGNAAGQLGALVGPLESMGYVVAAGIFSSGRTGNSHGRERLVVVADCASGGFREQRASAWQERLGYVDGCVAGLGGSVANADGGRDSTWSNVTGSSAGVWADGEPAGSGDPLAQPTGGGRNPGSDVAARQVFGLQGSSRSAFAGNRGGQLAHPNGERQRREGVAGHAPADAMQPGPRFPPAVIPGPSDPAWRDILDRWPQLAPALSEAEAQSLLRGGLDAVASRIERLRACGNGVDPVVGAYAVLRLGALLADERSARAGHAAVREPE